jgi:ferredoxin-NADP reductase
MGLHSLISRRDLTDSAYVLRFERNGFIFTPGQHINVGIIEDDDRPYSVYSGVNDDYIEILIKEVKNGNISTKLKLLQLGDSVSVGQPHGSFTIEAELKTASNFLFISTGTGISPYHSFVRSYPGLEYKIIHGIRYSYESYDNETYGDRYISCVTQDVRGDFRGRVSDYLENQYLVMSDFYFLCGNTEMIDEIFELLIKRGLDKMQIKSEGYF